MADQVQGRFLQLSPARKMVMEILHHARKVPSLPLAKTLNVGLLASQRQQMESPCSWMAIFLRAYGLISQRCPQLRRCLVGGWRYRLYEHPSAPPPSWWNVNGRAKHSYSGPRSTLPNIRA